MPKDEGLTPDEAIKIFQADIDGSDFVDSKRLRQAEQLGIEALEVVKEFRTGQYKGYGFWPRETEVHGADKGNCPHNMAFIRSERNALDRMAPGASPDLEVADESFVEVFNTL
jgi:hypothetical protein